MAQASCLEVMMKYKVDNFIFMLSEVECANSRFRSFSACSCVLNQSNSLSVFKLAAYTRYTTKNLA